MSDRNELYQSGALLFPDEESACMNYFGIGFLTVHSAAELIARNKNQDPDEPLKVSQVAAGIKKIVSGINKKQLEAALLRRLKSGGIDVNRTYISSHIFSIWCDEHEIDINPEFERFLKSEEKILSELSLAYDNIRSGKKTNKASTKKELALVYNALNQSNAELENYRKKSLSPRERSTLLKLVLGMAITFHGHDRSKAKTKTAKEISSALFTKGIKVDEDTVRKWLQIANEEVESELDKNF